MDNKKSEKYTVPENEDFEPGSNNEVLKNYPGITSKDQIEILEEHELFKTIEELENIITKEHQFVSEDICAIHESWLGDIYPFAGKYRTVTMSKAGFPFAAPSRIEPLMEKLESDFLQKYTPCNYQEIQKVAHAIAVVHVEFILIHPFREGNGRTARILASLMANQAGLPPLNFELIDQTVNPEGYAHYINAIQGGVSAHYEPITAVFENIIQFTQKKADF